MTGNPPPLPVWRVGVGLEVLRAWAIGTLIVLAVAASNAFGGPVRGPVEVKVEVGRLSEVPLEFDGDEIVYAILGGDYFGGFREFSDPKVFKFQVLGYTPGTGHIVVGTTKGGKLQPIYTVKVIVGGGVPVPPPPPGPGPIPDDPEVTALATKLRAAANTDAWHPSKLSLLATGYAGCVPVVAAGGTVAKVGASCRAAITLALAGEDVSPTVHDLLTAELKSVLPSSPTATIDPVAAKKLFVRISKALEKASKS